MTLDEFKDKLAMDLFGMTKDQALEKGICIDCKRLAADGCHTELDRKEWMTSGICGDCYDALFEGR